MHAKHKADQRHIEEKALGLIYAMTDAQAAVLHNRLKTMAGGAKTAGQLRAAMFCGKSEQGEAQ